MMRTVPHKSGSAELRCLTQAELVIPHFAALQSGSPRQRVIVRPPAHGPRFAQTEPNSVLESFVVGKYARGGSSLVQLSLPKNGTSIKYSDIVCTIAPAFFTLSNSVSSNSECSYVSFVASPVGLIKTALESP